MHITTENCNSKPSRRQPRGAPASRSRTRPEPHAAPQQAIEPSAQSLEQHDPMLLLAALEEIESRQNALEVLFETGLLAHCLQ